MQSIYILISSILVFISYLIYEWSIVTGRTKPHRTTRFVLLLITALGAASLFAQQDRVAIWLIGISAVQSVVVFALSFKWGMGGWDKSDLACLAIALVGIVVWKITDDPALGLYASVAADLAGMLPALLKTYRQPHTEYWMSYIFDIAAAGFTLLAISAWQPQGYLYPMYIFVVNLVMLLFILRPKISKLLQHKS